MPCWVSRCGVRAAESFKTRPVNARKSGRDAKLWGMTPLPNPNSQMLAALDAHHAVLRRVEAAIAPFGPEIRKDLGNAIAASCGHGPLLSDVSGHVAEDEAERQGGRDQ